MKQLHIYILSILCTLALTACGGGGGDPTPFSYSGSTSSATVDGANSEALSRTTLDAAGRAPTYQASSGFFKSSEPQVDIESISLKAKQMLEDELRVRFDASTASRIDITESCDNGGSVRTIFPDLNENDPDIPQTGTGTFIFDMCDEFGELVDGVLDFVWDGFDDDQGFINYTLTVDVTVTLAGQPAQSISGTITCTNFGNNCSSSEDFLGSDGGEVRVENVEVTGNSTTGYNMDARVYNGQYGYIDIVATGIIFCDNGNIQSGSISVTDSTGFVVLSVTFSNCDEFTVTFNGVATDYSQ